MVFELPELPYALDDLEPYISGKTMELHYLKYHRYYINRINSLVSGTNFENKDPDTIIKVADGAIFNFAAQAWNHTFYFNTMGPDADSLENTSISDVIIENFGSVKFLKTLFTKTALSLFGVGWVWLVLNSKGGLEIVRENNAGNPLRRGMFPLLACDLWEHAYFLDYNDRTEDYLNAFWRLVDWRIVADRHTEAMKSLNIYHINN
ncbi:MAG TPA: superoxide dismutase [Bacteroidales bacterium]|nr:superoxide dismutase [Bacteroidales bacterium]